MYFIFLLFPPQGKFKENTLFKTKRDVLLVPLMNYIQTSQRFSVVLS